LNWNFRVHLRIGDGPNEEAQVRIRKVDCWPYWAPLK
jgi:hypothetical protein